MGLVAEQHQQLARGGGGLVRGSGVECPPNALGSPGGARCVEHERSGGEVLGLGPRLALARDQLVEGAEALHRPAHTEAVRLGRHAASERLGGLGAEALVHDEGPGLGVVDDVADLGTDEVPVDGGHVQAALVCGQAHGQLLEAVGQQGRHLVALAEPGSPQAPRDPVGQCGQLAEGQLVVLSIDHGQEVRIGFGDAPQPQGVGVCHGPKSASGIRRRVPSGSPALLRGAHGPLSLSALQNPPELRLVRSASARRNLRAG